MKTIKYMFMIIAAIAAISCIQEENPVTDSNKDIKLVPMTFIASIDKGTDTKVMYDGAKTKWEANDKIMVISNDGSANEFNIVSLENDGTTAVFSGESSENATEYYAVYPSSAYKGDGTEAVGKDGKLYVEVKATQQAIAGTFDPSAALAIARSDADGNIVFKHSCTYLKFQLADAADVKKVHLSVNGSDNVAGIGYLGVSASDLNTQFATTDDKLSKYNMITLLAPEDGFVAGEDYFIAMRANSCTKGLTMYVEYEDCVKSRTSTNQVFVAEGDKSGSIGKIKDLGQLDKNLTTLTPYEAYNFGADIMVAGKAINKATYGDATLISSTSSSKAINNKGVFFVDSDVEVSLGAGQSTMIVIGNDPNIPSKASRSAATTYYAATDSDDIMVFYNMALTYSNVSSNYGVITISGTGTFETVAFVGCKINIPEGIKFFINSNSSRNISNLTISDSDIKFNSYEADIVPVFINTEAESKYETVDITNNVFYSVKDIKEFRLFANTKMSFKNFILNRNSFVNIYPGDANKESFIYAKEIENLSINNSLFHIPNYSKYITAYCAIFNCITYPTNTSISKNVGYYGGTRPSPYLKLGDTTLSQHPSNLTTSPYSASNIESGIFTNAGDYGAIR